MTLGHQLCNVIIFLIDKERFIILYLTDGFRNILCEHYKVGNRTMRNKSKLHIPSWYIPLSLT